MKTIKIAPNAEEVFVEGNEVRTDFAGGIVYRANGLTERFKESFIIECFRYAIALSSKRWQLQEILNNHFQLDGVVE